jgi:ATP-dependent RNA helicase RhlE
MKFDELGLSADLLRAIAAQGYDTPTPIQAKAIPAVLTGRDLMAGAQTGTGKTAAFVLPILQRLATIAPAVANGRGPRVLVLVPTRELAVQVEESVRLYGQFSRIRSAAVYGGVGMQPQVAALRRGLDFLVATPGRLLDHMGQRTCDLSSVEILVLDEADRMLDMGFIHDMKKILAKVPRNKQSLLFSATFSDEIRELAHTLLKDPETIEVARRNAATELVAQRIYHVDRDRKRELLLHLFDNHGWNQVLVFTRTKYGADALSEKLDRAGIRSAALHGNKTQGARQRALNDFKSGKLVALVATDIAARGIDIDSLPYVVNFELPNVAEDYVHRIGRTGRAGTEGEAISLVSGDERGQLRDIERLIKRQLDVVALPGFEPTPGADKPLPDRRGGKPRPQGNGGRSGEARAKSGGGQGRGRTASGGRPAGTGADGNAPPARGVHRNGTRHH